MGFIVTSALPGILKFSIYAVSVIITNDRFMKEFFNCQASEKMSLTLDMCRLP